ncbi:MAG TPA: hypothetical protein VGQ29_00745 [Gemmatimonadales bacterium]|jgi:hypothetical protein|nr:hypothetical protein [Gemmatimonadales bacterium]
MTARGGRFSGWAVRGLVVLLTAQPLNRLSAQHVSIGPQVVFGDYREVSSDLHYRGTGIGAKTTLTWKKLSADVVLSKVKYKPVQNPTGTLTNFDASEVDVRLRYYVTGPVSAELGLVHRTMDPEFEAQSVGAITLGARMAYVLGPGVRMSLNGGLLFGSKFSGGGTTSALGALQLGLGVNVDALHGRVQLTGDYGFQRFSRKTDDGSGPLPAPIQQSLGRIGFAIAL